MAALFGDIADIGTNVTIDKSSVDYVGKVLIGVVAVGLILWVLAKKYNSGK